MTEVVLQAFRDGADFYDMLRIATEGEDLGGKTNRTIVCKNCGDETLHTGSGLCATCYRDPVIRSKYPAQVQLDPVVVCVRPSCGKQFERTVKGQRYCSAECRKEENRERELKRLRELTAAKRERLEREPNAWQIFVSDPFPDGRFADGICGLNAQICPLG